MILGVGLDIVSVERIRALRERRGERFLRRVFTAGEAGACLGKKDPAPSLAARFAAKEAGMKALGTGWSQGVGWQDLEVVSGPSGAPALVLRGRAAEAARSRGVGAVHLSLTHDAGAAAAVVILEATS
ncbi:MAG: holo-ACP synthase [Deferrisomatales bacterium]|nr:holo-ACP synthase [Deferrisomatales bacterium]